MIVMQVHNQYFHAGGEDAVVEAEGRLLAANRNVIKKVVVANSDLETATVGSRLRTGIDATWSQDAYGIVRASLRRDRPDVMHCHNTFPLLSPAVYHAAAHEGVPVVQTLHNFRLLCVNALLFRGGRVCRDCVGRVPLAGIIHACYRGSRLGSASVAAMLVVHRLTGTWNRNVERYIALSDVAKREFVQGGLPEERIVVKSNFVHPDPGPGKHEGEFALYVGRLSEEKGIRTLLAAWAECDGEIPLRIVGDGPLRPIVERAAQTSRGITWLGHVPPEQVLDQMRAASFLIMPSLWYEHAPMVLLQAFATGLPAAVSGHGALAEMVDRNRTGWHFTPGDSDALAHTARQAWRDPEARAAKSAASREQYLASYTAERNYETLMGIYREAIAQRSSQATHASAN